MGGTTGTAGGVIPHGLGPVSIPNNGIVQLIVQGTNVALGIFGLFIIILGIWRLLKLFWDLFRGRAPDNSGHILGKLGGVPAGLGAILEILAGLVIAGLVMSGAWVSIVDGLINIGSHVGGQIGNQLNNAP